MISTKLYHLALSLVATASVLAMASDASAVPLTDLFAGGSITVGDKLFDNWTLITNSINGSEPRSSTEFNLANVDVSGDNSDPLNPKLVFTPSASELTVTQNGGVGVTAALDFSYDVSVQNPNFQWVDSSHVANFSEVTVVNNDHSAHLHGELFTDSTLSTQIVAIGPDTHLIRDDTIPTFVDESNVTDTVFFAGRTSGTMLQELTWNTDSNTESVGISSFTVGFSQQNLIPEPSSAISCLVGFTFFVIRRYRRR